MGFSLPDLWRSAVFNTLRFAFRLAPLGQSTRDRLRQRFLEKHAGLVPAGPRGKFNAKEMSRRAVVRADEKSIGYVAYAQSLLPDPLPATLVAFYLPQFHCIPENDQWWGNGFTEWRNVTRALPQFEGHAQPRLPGDLGFYNLDDPEVMRTQARLAREYGIGAFCFYFYWFGGKTLLEKPLRNWLADGSLDLPFCLCWANENWSRRWDGRGDEILIQQSHSAEDDLKFIRHIAEYFSDPRYLKVAGRPLLLVYRPNLMPDCKATAERWRAWCRENGIGEIHLAYVQSFESPDPSLIGFDAAVEFPPNRVPAENVTSSQTLVNPGYTGQVLDWRSMRNAQMLREPTAYRLYPGINVGWDNEPRRSGAGRSYVHASPRDYREWLEEIIDVRLRDIPRDESLIFVNAWNEWAEGAVLEPDCSVGYAWLEMTRQALQQSPRAVGDEPSQHPTVVIHAWYEQEFEEILIALKASGVVWRVVVTTCSDRADSIMRISDSHGIQASIHVVENRGRDVLPFLRMAEILLEEGVDRVLKLHTKKSPHLSNGDQWRRELLDRLLDPAQVAADFAAFAEDQRLGLLVPGGHLLKVDRYMGANFPAMAYLRARCGIQARSSSTEQVFASGSMFWIRLEALRPLLDAYLKPSEFEVEAGQLDGTLAHAIERLLGESVDSAGFSIRESAHLAPGASRPNSYKYAAPSN